MGRNWAIADGGPGLLAADMPPYGAEAAEKYERRSAAPAQQGLKARVRFGGVCGTTEQLAEKINFAWRMKNRNALKCPRNDRWAPGDDFPSPISSRFLTLFDFFSKL